MMLKILDFFIKWKSQKVSNQYAHVLGAIISPPPLQKGLTNFAPQKCMLKVNSYLQNYHTVNICYRLLLFLFDQNKPYNP